MGFPDTIATSGSTIDTISVQAKLGLVIIGRNEGDRLVRCLESVRQIANTVYVDSGSSDGSVQRARQGGVTVVELPIPPNFTAARARNAGIAALLSRTPDIEFIQMVDGDCELRTEWLLTALPIINAEPDLAAVYGRLRERYPEKSVYNALCDDEWDLPVGEGSASGGVALFRVAALQQVGCYKEAMIAGEDSELSVRLRNSGWHLRCLRAEMAWHDAALVHFSQWWRRARRAGHGFAQLASLHPDSRKPNWSRSVRSILAWGGALPAFWLIAIALALSVDSRFWIAAVLSVSLWPLRMLQLIRRERRRGLRFKVACASGILLILGKLPQFFGWLGYHRDRLTGRASRLIEHKIPHGVSVKL